MKILFLVRVLFLFLMLNVACLAQNIELVRQKKLDSSIKTMKLSSDNNFLFTGDESGYIHKRETRELESQKKESSHSEAVSDIEIFDDKYVISTSSDERLVIRNFNLNYINDKFLSDHISSIDLSHDGKYLISAGVDKKIRLFLFSNINNCLNTINAHADLINDIRFCDKSKKIISVSDDNHIKIFNTNGSKANKTLPLNSSVKIICFHPGKEIFACSTENDEVLIIDLNYFELLNRIDIGQPVTDLQFTDQGAYLFVSTSDGYIKVINSQNRKIVYRFKAHNGEINDIALSNNTDYLYTASDDKYLKKWDISNFEIKNRIATLNSVRESKFKKFSKKLEGELSLFKKQKKKSEFETNTDYKQRLQKIGEKEEKLKGTFQENKNEFNQIINMKIQELTKIQIPMNDIKFKLGQYNAEKEYFSVTLEDIAFELPVPKNDAKSFKMKFNEINCSGIFSYTPQIQKKYYLLKFETPDGKIYKTHPHNYAEDTGLPPQIVYEIKFQDENHNNVLEVNEKAKIIITLKNEGKGSAYGLKGILTPSRKYKFLNFTPEQKIPLLNPNDEKEIAFNISTSSDAPSDSCNFTIKFFEENDFEPVSKRIIFYTSKFEKSKITFEHKITDPNNNQIIEPSEIIKVTTRIFNRGGSVFELQGKLLKDENISLAANSKDNFQLNDIAKGKFKDIEFSFYVNNKGGNIIPLSLKLVGKNFTKIYDYKFKYGKRESNISSIIVERDTIKYGDIETLTSDVDKNIPVIKTKNEDAVAVIIGNCNYKNKNRDIGNVDFAIQDAISVREYLISAFGFQEENIIFEKDIDKTKFETIFGNEDDYTGRLYDFVRPEKSDVFIYYAGHGLPDVNSKTGYLASINCDIKEIPLSCYSLQTLYENLSKIPFKSLTVIIDACFSGNSSAGQLIKDASPVSIKIDQPVYGKDNYVIMAASSSDQIASWYREKRHSLFTYYFLKGVQGSANADSNNVLTIYELKKYLSDEVKFQAQKIWGRDQYPDIKYDNENKVIMKY